MKLVNEQAVKLMQKNAIFSLTEYERTKYAALESQRSNSDSTERSNPETNATESFLAKFNSLMFLVNEISTKIDKTTLEIIFFKGSNVAKLTQDILTKKA